MFGLVREVIDGIYEIDTKPLGQEQIVASYLIKASGGAALIDPGFPASSETVLSGIKEAGFDPTELKWIVLTHTHIDHAGGAGKIAQIAKKARIITHKRGVFYLENSGKIHGGSKMVFGDELSEELGAPVDITGERIEAVEDGESIDLGDRRLRVYGTPGHCGDHVPLDEEETKTLFPGDTACLHYPQLGHVLIPAGSPPIYLTEDIIEELHRLSQLDIKRILTPHFGAAPMEPGVFLEENLKTVKEMRGDIEKMFSEGLEFRQVVEKLRAEIIGASGKSESETPEFLSGVWLRTMLKTGLMGYMADILEYARDLRPFNEPASEAV